MSRDSFCIVYSAVLFDVKLSVYETTSNELQPHFLARLNCAQYTTDNINLFVNSKLIYLSNHIARIYPKKSAYVVNLFSTTSKIIYWNNHFTKIYKIYCGVSICMEMCVIICRCECVCACVYVA